MGGVVEMAEMRRSMCTCMVYLTRGRWGRMHSKIEFVFDREMVVDYLVKALWPHVDFITGGVMSVNKTAAYHRQCFTGADGMTSPIES